MNEDKNNIDKLFDKNDDVVDKKDDDIDSFLSRFDTIGDSLGKFSEKKPPEKSPYIEKTHYSQKPSVWENKDFQNNSYNNNQKEKDPDFLLEHFESKSQDLNSSEHKNPMEEFVGRAQRHQKTKSKGRSKTTSLDNEFITSTNNSEKINNFEKLESEVNMEGHQKKIFNKSKKKKTKKILLIIASIFLVIGVAGVVTLTSIILSAPPINPETIYSLLSENSTMYDDQGQVIDNLVSSEGFRTNISFTELSPDLINAFVAIEDKTFWEHNGFNFIRIMGAIKEKVFGKATISGTSTITQQLARNLYLAEMKSERSLDRKLKEAYYTVLLEKHLSKEQILEAYLNTIYLGFNSNGVQAASQSYFSKNAADLNIAECATLASLPQAPDRTALIKKYAHSEVAANDPNIVDTTSEFTFLYNDLYISRKNLVLKFMKDQGKITEAQYQEALAYDVRASINPSDDTTREITSYFADYVIKDVIKGLMETLKLSESDARYRLYNGGLRIYTTMNAQMQKTVESEFTNNANFPSVVNLRRDRAQNILDSTGKIILYSYNNYFDGNGNFTLTPEEYEVNSDGSILVYAGKRLNFYNTDVQGSTDYSVEFKDMYIIESGTFYGIKGGVIKVPQEYKSKDANGNLIISPQLNADFPNFLQFGNNGIVIAADKYALKQRTVQPQSSMVIIDYKQGAIKAMVGGRGVTGKLLYNRATSPRQPGSSMKPIGAYGPALQASVDQLNGGGNAVTDRTQVYGNFWTAASSINDAPIKLPDGKLWPKNWYTGFKGMTRMRVAIEQSVNTCAVKVFNDIGVSRSVKFAKSLGITSIVEEGAVSDLNPAAMALGGMTYGVSPLEMAAAYGSFANEGTYVSPSSYTKVTNKKDEVILEAKHNYVQAMDKGVAFIMTDMLRSAVVAGIAGNAAIPNQPVAGKTGTTNDNYDAWFVGYTPYYVGALWIGNDVNIELGQGSIAATRVWARIMKQVHTGLASGKFARPDNVVSAYVDSFNGYLPSGGGSVAEYFIKGTQPTSTFKGSYPAGANVPKKEEEEEEKPEEITPNQPQEPGNSETPTPNPNPGTGPSPNPNPTPNPTPPTPTPEPSPETPAPTPEPTPTPPPVVEEPPSWVVVE